MSARKWQAGDRVVEGHRHQSAPGEDRGDVIRTHSAGPEVTTHSFRRSMATLIDDEGLSPRVGADPLGHSKVSMTQDRYMSRGRVHTEVAELLDRTIKDE
jgi:integrase